MCTDKVKVDRRKVMKWVVAGVGATTAGILSVPSILSTASPLFQKEIRKKKWTALGRLDRFTLGETKSIKVQTRLDKDILTISLPKDVYVWRKSEEELVVFSRSCTDLGCPINFDAKSTCFFCPCHGGIFSQEGERMAGPPKSPLYRYDYKIRDGFVEIDLTSVPPVA